jgi:cell division protein FtsB
VLCGLTLSAYFVQHTIAGTHGLNSRTRLVERSLVLQREILVQEAVRDRLKRDVTLLSAEPPDPDLVDELARSVLGMTRPGDVVLLPASKAR